MRHVTAVLVSISIFVLAGFVAATDAAPAFPEVIPLPTGFRPEGIVAGHGTEFFVGSLAGGAIFKGDLRTGEGGLLVQQSQMERIAVGLAYDARTDYLYVAGGGTGAAYVYDGTTGEEIAMIQLTDPGSFVNDVIVTREAAYFTDSFRPYLYKVPLSGSGEPQETVTEMALAGDFVFIEQAFNANGIDATPNGKWLIVVNSTTGELYRVDPETGVAAAIDLADDATVPQGDGILLDGKTLYVVQNRMEKIAVIELAPDLLSGEIVETILNADVGGLFRVPTTITKFGNALYAVNARFGVDNPSEADYDVVRVPKP